MIKPDGESIAQWFKENKILILLAGLGLVLLVGVVLMTENSISHWLFNRSVRKDREALTEKTKQIANETQQIEEMKRQRAEHVGELKELTNNLANANVADEQARADINASANEVQKAVANLANAINANSNVNATVEDVTRKLDKLDIH